MARHTDLDFIFTEGIEPGLRDCDFKEVVHIGKHPSDLRAIDEHLLASIRQSGVVVADFTGNRQNVYFEAGYAMGLGIPVIRTCRAGERGLVAFDQNHYAVHEWKDGSDLRRLVRERAQKLKELP